MKKSYLKILTLALIGESIFPLIPRVEASPSDSYKNRDCWNNHDFITPNSYKFRYCLLEEETFEKIDNQSVKDHNNKKARERRAKKS